MSTPQAIYIFPYFQLNGNVSTIFYTSLYSAILLLEACANVTLRFEEVIMNGFFTVNAKVSLVFGTIGFMINIST